MKESWIITKSNYTREQVNGSLYAAFHSFTSVCTRTSNKEQIRADSACLYAPLLHLLFTEQIDGGFFNNISGHYFYIDLISISISNDCFSCFHMLIHFDMIWENVGFFRLNHIWNKQSDIFHIVGQIYVKYFY